MLRISLNQDAPKAEQSTRRSLRALLRPAPPLFPEDSLARALRLMRLAASDSLPVVTNGRMIGMICESDIADRLTGHALDEIASELAAPVATAMHPASLVLRPAMQEEEIRHLCTAENSCLLRCIPVVDADDYCLGVVHLHDLLLAETPRPRPATIGGMATPFGVYLTDGVLQAGVGNLALVASGATMGLTLWLAYAGAYEILWLLQHYGHFPATQIADLDSTNLPHDAIGSATTIGFNLLRLAIFFGLMRFTILAGYHAAEHQTVHAIERSEPLIPSVVARMPRVHPRCGTNIMAAALLYFTLGALFRTMPALDGLAEILAALITVCTWRRVGSFLQQRFTTRKASQRQIQSGIAAGEELMAKYAVSTPARPGLLRKIWCMGMLQSLLGTLLVGGLAILMTTLWSRLHP